MRRRMWRDIAASVIACVLFALLAAYIEDQYVVLLGTFFGLAALAVTLDLLIGTTGLLALGHAAFFALGGYLAVILNERYHWNWALAALTAVIVAALLAVVVAVPTSIRTAGFQFSIVTFAVGELLVQLASNTTSITGGSEGMSVSFGLGSRLPFDWTVYRLFTVALAGGLLVALLVAAVVRGTHYGLRLRAVKESEPLTRGLGFNPTTYKVTIFVLSSAVAAFIGVLYAPMVGFLSPDLAGVNESIYILGLLFVGGMRSTIGACLGVFLLAILPVYLEVNPTARPIIVGVAMAIVVLVAPDRGIAGLLRDGWELLARRIRGSGSPGTAAPPTTVADAVDGDDHESTPETDHRVDTAQVEAT